MKITLIVVAAWLITSSEGRSLRLIKGKQGGQGKKLGQGKEILPWMNQKIVPPTTMVPPTTTGMPGKELDLIVTITSIFNVKDNPVFILQTLIDGGASNFGIMAEMTNVEMPVVSKTLTKESETTDADGNVRKETLIKILGKKSGLFVPVFGPANSSKGSSKFLEFVVHNEEGELIESGGSYSGAGQFVLVDGTKVTGKTLVIGSQKIDRNTGIVTLEGEFSFNGSIKGGNKDFTGELKTGGFTRYDCSNGRCNDKLANGQYLGGGGFTSLDGVNIQENGATFDGHAETSGGNIGELVGELFEFTFTGNATWSGTLTNSDGEEFAGKWFTDGGFKIDENFKDLGGDGSISFNGNYKNEDSEFQGLVSSEGDRTVDDSPIQTLTGNVLFDGNLTDTSKELFTMGKFSTGGSVSFDENFADLGGDGFVEFDGKSNSGVLVLKVLGLYEGGATFTGFVRTAGSRVINEDGTVTLDGSVQVGDDIVASGSLTFDPAGGSGSLLLASQDFELTNEDQFEIFLAPPH